MGVSRGSGLKMAEPARCANDRARFRRVPLLRHQHLVDDHDDAVALEDVIGRNVRGVSGRVCNHDIVWFIFRECEHSLR